MARSWLRVSEFDKFRDNRRGRNSPLEADNAAHTTTPRPRQVVFVAFASKGYRGGAIFNRAYANPKSEIYTAGKSKPVQQSDFFKK